MPDPPVLDVAVDPVIVAPLILIVYVLVPPLKYITPPLLAAVLVVIVVSESMVRVLVTPEK